MKLLSRYEMMVSIQVVQLAQNLVPFLPEYSSCESTIAACVQAPFSSDLAPTDKWEQVSGGSSVHP
jgi:hypothetical protein